MHVLARLLTTNFLILLIANFSFGQGCSDAGVCTAGIMAEHGDGTGSTSKFNLNLGYHLAKGDDGTKVNMLMLEAAYLFSANAYFQIKLPYVMTNGNLAKTSGLGDITLSFNGLIKESNGHRFEAFLGSRISAGNANLNENGLPLPMVYQTNLGTTDLLLGAKWSFKGWAGSLGYQQPLVQNNENGFLKSLWEGNEAATKYSDSKKTERKGDISARIEKTITPGDFAITAGLVPIYHLGEDTFVEENGERLDIKGSDGLTLNIAISARYSIGESLFLNVFYGSPLITRDVQPAGLARSYAGGLSIGYRF